MHIDELKDRFSLSELNNIYNIVKPKETLPIRRLKVIDTYDFSIIDLDVKYITSNNIEICGLGSTAGYLKTDIGLDYLDMDLYGNCYDSKSLSYMPLFLNNKIACKLYNYCLVPIHCRGSSKRVSVRVDTRDLSLRVSVDDVSLFVDVVDKKVEVCVSECIVSNERLESEDYYLVVGTLTLSCFKNIVTKVSKDIWEFGDTVCVLLNRKNSPNNIIVPNKYKKVCLDVGHIGKGAFGVVIPPSVDLVSLDRALEIVGVEYYLSNGNLTLYFPKASKTKNIIRALYKSLLKDTLTINALTSGFIDINSLVKKIKDEYNIDIKFY